MAEPSVPSDASDPSDLPVAPARRRPGPLVGALLLIALAALPLLLFRFADVSAQAPSTQYRIGDKLQGAATTAGDGTKTIDWDALMPPDWDPARILEQFKIDQMSDSDPRANQLLRQMQDALQNAPPNPALDGKPVRIAGFVVPLGARRNQLREFLLVPYFGACIHVPPPPSNQVIHVTSAEPVGGVRSMDAVWIEGVLRASRKKTPEGDAGYGLTLERIAPYAPPSSAK